jgi:hypothetical protein
LRESGSAAAAPRCTKRPFQTAWVSPGRFVYGLVRLWYAGQLQHGLATSWLVPPWCRARVPSFVDILTAPRQDSRALVISRPPCPPMGLSKPAQPASGPLAAAA